MKAVELTGHVYGLYTVLNKIPRTKPGQQHWLCRCQCGNERAVASYDLRNGLSKSCGCRKSEITRASKTTHGGKGTREYSTWRNMKNRCYNKNIRSYKHYGERGIEVCERWRNSFPNFLEDMGKCPDLHTMDRIDVNGHYEPSNCLWVTDNIQRLNTRRTLYATLDGETKTIYEWCKLKNLRYRTIVARIKYYGWSDYKAFNTPVNRSIS